MLESMHLYLMPSYSSRVTPGPSAAISIIRACFSQPTVLCQTSWMTEALQKSTAVTHLIGGSLSGLASCLTLQPLDLIKTRIQQSDTLGDLSKFSRFSPLKTAYVPMPRWHCEFKCVATVLFCLLFVMSFKMKASLGFGKALQSL